MIRLDFFEILINTSVVSFWCISNIRSSTNAPQQNLEIDRNNNNDNHKIKNENVSVIQFSAAWCGPCKTLKPVMDKLADEYKDKAGFYYADIEDGGINTGSAAGVRGVPTVIIYKKGIEVDRKVGGVPESNMKEFLEKNI